MRQKFTITIDKNSPEAVSFLNESIAPYLTFIDEACSNSTFIADYVKLDEGFKTFQTEHKRYIKATVTTFVSDDKLTLMTDEDWTAALYTLNSINGCSEYPEGKEIEIPDDAEPQEDSLTETNRLQFSIEELLKKHEQDEKHAVQHISIIDELNAAYEVKDKDIVWDYNKLIREYLKSDNAPDGVSIKMLRIYDSKCPGLSSVDYWDSSEPDRFVGCGHKHPGMFYLDYGKAVLPEEIPDKMWHGLPVNIEMFRFDGYMDANSPEMPNRRVPYSGLKPISKELADKYQPTPEYVDEIEDKLGQKIYVEYGNNGSSLLELDDYYADTYTINDNVDSADTSGVLEYINTVAELAENVERSNDEFLDDLGFDHDDTMITAFAVYYSDDNDILQAFYDTSEQQFVYTLFQPGSSDNTDLTQED